jgi:hypothetical protein
MVAPYIRRVRRNPDGSIVFRVPQPTMRAAAIVPPTAAEHLANLARLIGCAQQLVDLLGSSGNKGARRQEEKCEQKNQKAEASLPRSPLLRLLDQGKPVPGVGRAKGGACSRRSHTRAAKRGGG